MPAFSLSATSDEIDANPITQLVCLQQNSIPGLDVRSVWGKPAQQLTDDEVKKIKQHCTAAKIRVQCVVGTAVPVLPTAPLSEAIANLERLLAVAQQFGTQRIRLTAGEIPPGTRAADFMGASIGRLRHLAQIAETAGVTLLIENAPGTAGDIPGNIHSILHGVKSAYVRLAWNPGNFVQAGVEAQVAEYQGMLLKYVSDVIVHDATLSDKQSCLLGDGDGCLRDLLLLLRANAYEGGITLQPNLIQSSNPAGLSGTEFMALTATMLREMLTTAGIKW